MIKVHYGGLMDRTRIDVYHKLIFILKKYGHYKVGINEEIKQYFNIERKITGKEAILEV